MLECVFVLLPGVADRSEFTSAVAVPIPLRKSALAMCALLVLVIEHPTHVTLNPQSDALNKMNYCMRL